MLKSWRSSSRRIRTVDKDFPNELDFKDTQVLAKIRDIHKTEKKNLLALEFLVMKIKKYIQSLY